MGSLSIKGGSSGAKRTFSNETKMLQSLIFLKFLLGLVVESDASWNKGGRKATIKKLKRLVSALSHLKREP